MRTSPIIDRSVSVGQLMRVPEKNRAAFINTLPAGTRMKLAHLASFALDRDLAKVEDYRKLITELTKERP